VEERGFTRGKDVKCLLEVTFYGRLGNGQTVHHGISEAIDFTVIHICGPKDAVFEFWSIRGSHHLNITTDVIGISSNFPNRSKK